MGTNLAFLEKIAAESIVPVITQLIDLIGTTVNVYRAETLGVYEKVYGVQGKNDYTAYDTIEVLLSPGGFISIDSVSVGLYEASYIYSLSEVTIGDILEVVREDNLLRRLKIKSVQNIGSTDKILYRYGVVALGD